MKTTPNVALIVLACAGLSPLRGGEAGEAEEVKMRPSPEQLAQRMAERTNPLANHRDLETVAPEDIQKRSSHENLGGLLERSTILAYGKFWTLVPKGAVLHVPSDFRERLSSRPSGTLLPWNQFYARNKGWIFTQPVTIEHARGEKPLSEAVLENHRRLGRVVISVLHNGPISVKAPPPAVAAKATDPDQSEPPTIEAP